MKKVRNHSHLKGQEDSPEGANNEMDLCSLLRADTNSNADHFRKELENIRSQETLENSFAEIQIELRAVKTRMNNAVERNW